MVVTTASFWKRLNDAFIRPQARSEDDSRGEYILNVLLTAAFVLVTGLFFTVLASSLIEGSGFQGVPPLILLFCSAFLALLLAISRFGFPKVSSGIVIATWSLAALYTNASRGVDLPMTWMFYALLVFMTGILLGRRVAVWYTILLSSLFIFLTWLQQSGLNPFFIEDWRGDGFKIPEAIGFAMSLGVVAVVSWLSNREIERSLGRARSSEEALKIERDSLEIKVQERTRELKEEQRERFEDIALFAEFGRHASGVLHDLANPLTSMSLSLQQARDADPEAQKRLMERVIKGTERMESLLRTARTQLSPTAEISSIVVSREAEQAAEILSHIARTKRVRLDLSGVQPLELNGSPYAFNRIILNLVSNAIEAYDGLERDDATVRVRSWKEDDQGFVAVEDDATGIRAEILGKLFEPFASTKIGKGGSGMGLATAKSLAERDFHGSLSVESTPGIGSRFTFRFPLRTDDKV